jgi:PAS domain S-box-containing protein
MNRITFSKVFGGSVILLVLAILISSLMGFRIFSAAGFVPRAQCGEWTSGLIALHNFSDFFIWASYLTIPIILVKFAYKRKSEIPFTHLFWLFGLFIIACGTTHLIDIILFYEPVYRLSGLIKLLTAAASVGTVFALVKVIPAALEMRSPESFRKELHEKQQIEEQLRNREKQLANAQKIARIGSWEWDIQSDRVNWSDELYRIYGLKPQEAEVTYESFLERVIPEDRNNTENEIRKSYLTKQPFGFYERIIQPDGTIRMLHSQGEVIVDEEGNAVEMIGTCQDVTRAKEQEAELRRTRDELELRVKERTEELEKINQTLQKEINEKVKAIEKRESALKEKEVLLKEIHHRVKNNLQVISSLINLQSAQIYDKDVLKFFNQTKNRIRSMALIHEKLYQSKNLSKVDFGEYVKELLDYINDTYKFESKIIINIDVVNVYLSIDTAISLGLIINEIASNSFKYAFHGRPTGELSISLIPENETKLKLTVKDNGIGFPKEIDFSNTTSLGLQLVNILVAQLKGEISLNRNEGTEFNIIFVIN